MRDVRGMAPALALLLAALGTPAARAAPASPAASAAAEADLLRQIKVDVLDERWEAVLGGCDQFLGRFAKSPDAGRAVYYRARALERFPGREEEALAAYGDFLTRYPSEAGTLREAALLSRVTLATSLYQKGNSGYVAILLKAMEESGYPRLYAAIQAGKIDHGQTRARALPMLKECARSESDLEVRNECVVALLRIDPKALSGVEPVEGRAIVAPPGRDRRPPTPPRGPPPPPPPGLAAGEAKLIRVEVFDKATSKIVVQVNLPLAFAELLLDSLGQEYRGEITKHLGVTSAQSLEKFWEAIMMGGKQTLVEVDAEDQRIRVWVE